MEIDQISVPNVAKQETFQILSADTTDKVGARRSRRQRQAWRVVKASPSRYK